MSSERYPSDNSPVDSTTPFERPEQIRIGTGIHSAKSAISSDYLRLEQAAGGSAKLLGEGSECGTLDEAGYSNSSAPSSLSITAGSRGDGIVNVDPHRT